MYYVLDPTKSGPTQKGKPAPVPPGGVANNQFAGITIAPMANPGFFNARREPNLNSQVAIQVKKGTRATGIIVPEGSRFWIQLDTPAGIAYVRSDVASWPGKKNSKTPTATGGKESGEAVKKWRPDLKDRPVGWLAAAPTVNVRKGPSVSAEVLRVATNPGFGYQRLGSLTGQTVEVGKTLWLEVEQRGQVGWVRSDVVWWKGSRTITERVVEPVKEAAKDVAEATKSAFNWVTNAALIVGGGYLLIKLSENSK